MLPRVYRLLLLVSVAWLVHIASHRSRPVDQISLSDARTFFPTAARLTGGDRSLGGQIVVDQQGRELGFVLTTSPHTDDIIGYSGPNDLLIALDEKQRVIGMRLLKSGDTQAHVDQIEKSSSYWKQFTGWGRDTQPGAVEGVSGSTLTGLAIAEAIQRRLGGQVTSLRFPESVTLVEIQSLFPDATNSRNDDPRPGWQRVLDHKSSVLGFAVRTSPYTDNDRGYRGPTETLVAIAPDGRTLTGLLIRRSYDTPEYVDRIREDEEFLRLLTGRTIEEWANLDFRSAGIEGVSGATQTSFAVASGLKKRFAADHVLKETASTFRRWNPGLVAIIVGGLVMTFTRLRTSRRLRTIWQGILIVVFMFWLGDLLSLALVTGWMRHGVPWKTAPSVVLLVAVAIMIPWTTRRQIYCQQICPHGAAQSWLGRFKRLHLHLHSRVYWWLVRLRSAILFTGLGLAIFLLPFDLAWLEPFDGWVLKSAAAISLAIAAAGLVASIFIPQAYCRFACPTGELLALLKSGGKHDRITRRDWLAGGLVILAAMALYAPPLVRTSKQLASSPFESNVTPISGQAFGTTWSVKLRRHQDTATLSSRVADELERIESTLSHWRPNSLTSQFNAVETTQAVEQPQELIALVAKAHELSGLTGGAYDITVAPLVDAWGFGPAGDKSEPPSEQDIQELLQRIGWQKLIVDTNDNTLRKAHPKLQIDLSSLLQGYAADRIAKLLDAAGIAEYLVNVGGELFARGSWRVAVEDPRDPKQPLRMLTLSNSALATSGFYRATKQLNDTAIHHLISPHTGRPVQATANLAAVIASTATDADAWATALLALGLPDGLRLAEEQNVAALLLAPNHQQQFSTLGSSLFGAN